MWCMLDDINPCIEFIDQVNRENWCTYPDIMAWNIRFESNHSFYIYHWPDDKSSRAPKTRQETRDTTAKAEELLQQIFPTHQIQPSSFQIYFWKPSKLSLTFILSGGNVYLLQSGYFLYLQNAKLFMHFQNQNLNDPMNVSDRFKYSTFCDSNFWPLHTGRDWDSFKK